MIAGFGAGDGTIAAICGSGVCVASTAGAAAGSGSTFVDFEGSGPGSVAVSSSRAGAVGSTGFSATGSATGAATSVARTIAGASSGGASSGADIALTTGVSEAAFLAATISFGSAISLPLASLTDFSAVRFGGAGFSTGFSAFATGFSTTGFSATGWSAASTGVGRRCTSAGGASTGARGRAMTPCTRLSGLSSMPRRTMPSGAGVGLPSTWKASPLALPLSSSRPLRLGTR